MGNSVPYPNTTGMVWIWVMDTQRQRELSQRYSYAETRASALFFFQGRASTLVRFVFEKKKNREKEQLPPWKGGNLISKRAAKSARFRPLTQTAGSQSTWGLASRIRLEYTPNPQPPTPCDPRRRKRRAAIPRPRPG